MNIQELKTVLEREPLLGDTGFIYRGNRQDNNSPADLAKNRQHFLLYPDLDTLTKVEEILRGLPRTKHVASGYSYHLKHVVERLIGEYVSNGQLIAVALHLGFQREIDGPNCIFNMFARDVKRLDKLSHLTQARDREAWRVANPQVEPLAGAAS